MKPELYRTHPVFERIEQYNNSISSELAISKIDFETSAYFKEAYHFLKSKLNIALPLLVGEAELNSIVSDLEAGTSSINTFFGDPNPGHIQNAINNIYNSISRVKLLPMPVSENDFDFAKAVTVFQQTVAANYENVAKLNSVNQEVLRAQNIELGQKQTQLNELSKLIADKQLEFQTILNNFNNDFENLKVNSNTIIEAERKKFADEMEADRKKYKDQNEIDNQIFKTGFEAQKAELNSKAEELVNQLNSKLEEARKIVNIVGNVGVTGNYQIIANQHKKSANNFRNIALTFMIVMSILLICSIVDLSSSDFNLYKSLMRILAAAVLTYPAVYASRESSKHRNLETQNRNLELELASIGPFIELLSDDKKQSIKEELVKKYFGRNNSFAGESGHEKDDVSVNALEKLLKVILPHIKK